MFVAITDPRFRRRTLGLLAAAGLLAGAAYAIGIDDNPPGVALLLLSVATIVLAFAHPFRTARPYKRLALGAIPAFVLAVILHNVLSGAASWVGAERPLGIALEVVGTAFFLIATLLCPALLLVGIVGAVVASWRERRTPSDPSA